MNKPTTSIAQKTRFVNFKLDEAEMQVLDEIAHRNGRTRSGEVRFALRNHLAAEQAKAAGDEAKAA